MNKEEFLKQIRLALRGLDPTEIDEIVADYRTHFDESLANGRSEQDTAAALGDPQWLAREHIADIDVAKPDLKETVKRLWGNMTRQQRNADVIERILDWTPGQRMHIGLPARVTWHPAEHPKATLRGPEWLLEHVRLDSDALRGRFKRRLFHDNDLQVDLEGPAIPSWALRGSGELHLADLDQPVLNLDLDGSGDITATGAVSNAFVDLRGTGDIDLEKLAVVHATAKVSGRGDITLASTQSAELTVEGSGDIALLSRPAKLKTVINGSGDIRNADGKRIPR